MNRYFSFPGLVAACLFVGTLSFTSCAQDVYTPNQVLKDVEILSADSMGGRLPNTPGHAKAQQYLVQRFREVGLQPVGTQYQHPFTFTARGAAAPQNGVNLVGMLPGASEKIIIISAHYDHVGTRNGKIFNGADDDASGMGAILAIAAHFQEKKPIHTLVFVAFDAEEQGLAGSRAFVAQLPFAKDRVLLNVNLDMVSISEKNELYVAGTFHHPWLKPMLEQVKVPEGLNLRYGHDRPEQSSGDWTLQSDHGSFHKAKIPFLYFGVEDHPHYHKETDEFQNIHQPFYLKAVETMLRAVQVLDKQLPV